jgi:hypothetical protein
MLYPTLVPTLHAKNRTDPTEVGIGIGIRFFSLSVSVLIGSGRDPARCSPLVMGDVELEFAQVGALECGETTARRRRVSWEQLGELKMPLRCDEKEINFVGRFEGIGGSGNIFGSGSIVGNIWAGVANFMGY